MPDPHESLVEMASRGDAVAVDALLERHLARLRAFIRLRSSKAVRERESMSDLVQSVCREVLQSLDNFEYRGEAAFRSWLFAKALGKIRDRARYHGAQKRTPEREVARQSSFGDGYAVYYATVTPSRVAIGKEEMRRLEGAFDELPEEHREAITLSRVVGLSNAEVAARMGRGEGSVRGLLYRGLTKLSSILSRDMPRED